MPKAMQSFAVLGFLSHVLLWGGISVDVISTRKALTVPGMVEQNPFVPHSLGKQIALNVGIGTAVELVGWAARHDSTPKWVAPTLRATVGAPRLAAGTWNTHARFEQERSNRALCREAGIC